jgi:hypothetical protein
MAYDFKALRLRTLAINSGAAVRVPVWLDEGNDREREYKARPADSSACGKAVGALVTTALFA